MNEQKLNEFALVVTQKIKPQVLSSLDWNFDKAYMSNKYELDDYSENNVYNIRKIPMMKSEFYRATSYVAQYKDDMLRMVVSPCLRKMRDIEFVVIIKNQNHQVVFEAYFDKIKDAIKYAHNITNVLYFRFVTIK